MNKEANKDDVLKEQSVERVDEFSISKEEEVNQPNEEFSITSSEEERGEILNEQEDDLVPTALVENPTIKKSEYEEDEETPIEQDILKKPYQCSVHVNSDEDYENLLNKESELDEKDVGKKGTPTDQLVELKNGPITSTSAMRLTKAIFNVAEEQFLAKELLKTTKWKCGDNVSGRNAQLAFTAHHVGLFRLYLYNTGIYIDMRPLRLGESHALFKTIDLRGVRLGGILGEYEHIPYNILFKEAVLDLLPTIVVNSNLKNFDRGKTLIRAISVQDYLPIVWALSAMREDRKLSVNVECLKCGSSDIRDLDYGKFHFVRNISTEALEFIKQDKPVGPDELKKYKELLGFDGSIFDYQGITIVRQVPSLFDDVTNGKACLAEIETRLGEEPTLTSIETINQLLLQTNNNFVPWISELRQLDKETGKLIFRTTDSAEFTGILNMYGLGETHQPFDEAMQKYMLDTKASVIGYTAQKCKNPECGAINPTATGYVSWDAERLFFETTYRVLASSQLTMY